MDRVLRFFILSFIFLVSFLSGFILSKNSLNYDFLSELKQFLSQRENKEAENLFLNEKLDKIISILQSLVAKNEELESKLGSIEEVRQTFFQQKESKVSIDENKSLEEKICQDVNQEPKHEVIFNEICWMGSENSSMDEWIELKNISEREVDLSGWQIVNKNQKLKILLEKNIPPGELFLLERTDDDTVPLVEADLIFNGPIKNSDETLYLFDNNCNLQDVVKADLNWPAGDLITKRTMERQGDFSWKTSFFQGGTPKKENSKEILEKSEEKLEEGANISKISLKYPQEVFAQSEFEVSFSVSDLKSDVYDIKISVLKISDESEQKRTISEISLEGEEWQDSYKYLTKVFTGISFSQKFKLRILQDYVGGGEIIAKIRRNSDKKIIEEYQGKINILKNQKTVSNSQNFFYSLPQDTNENKESLESTPTVLIENIPTSMTLDEILELKIKVTGVSGNQELRIGLSAPGDEQYPPSLISFDQINWETSGRYFQIFTQNGLWENTIFLKLNPQGARYNNIKTEVVLSSRLRIDGVPQQWNYHTTITISP